MEEKTVYKEAQGAFAEPVPPKAQCGTPYPWEEASQKDTQRRDARIGIRKAKAEDLTEILQIFADARAFMAAHGNKKQWTGGYPAQSALLKDIEKEQLYVCTDRNGGIAAVFVFYIGADPNYDYIEDGAWPNERAYGVIHRVAVSEAARGTGAAKFCIDWCFMRCGNLRIDTHEDNIPMQKLIAKCGFKRCGIVYMKDDGSPRIAYQKTARLILASASPRRRELMEKLGLPFIAETAEVEEILPEGLPAEKAAEYLSELKAKQVYEKHKGEDVIVIGSDTVVICDGRIFGKPKDKAEAAEMLRYLSGRTHEVHTGVTLLSDRRGSRFTSVTNVSFYPLTEEEIDAYIKTGEPMDKAGAYGIQGAGALLVRMIHGDYYTVMGFPIGEIHQKLKDF